MMPSTGRTTQPQLGRRPSRFPESWTVWTANKLFAATMATQARLAQALDPLGINPAHYIVLATLADAEELSLSRLIERLGVMDRSDCAAEVAEAMRDLESWRLVQQHANGDDGAEPRYELTSEGRQRLFQASKAVATADYAITAHLSPPERLAFRQLLDDLATRPLFTDPDDEIVVVEQRMASQDHESSPRRIPPFPVAVEHWEGDSG